MTHITRTFRVAVVATILALTLGAVPHAVAQPQTVDPNAYTSVLSEFEIAVSGPEFEITGAELQHYATGEGEIIDIEPVTNVGAVEVSFFDDADSPDESIDIYLASIETAADSFDVIDRGVSGTTSYALALVEYDGVAIAYYIQVTLDVTGSVDLLESLLVPAEEIEPLMTTAQAEITIDGAPFMDGVAPAQVGDVLANGGTLAGDEQPPATAEAGSGAVLPTSGATIEIGPDFTLAGEPTVSGNLEVQSIDGPGTQSMIAAGQTGGAPADILAQFTDGVMNSQPDAEVVHEDTTEGSALRVLWVPGTDGVGSAIVLVADTVTVPGFELVQAHEVPGDDVEGSLIAIQGQISINGLPALAKIDAGEIAALIADHTGEPQSDLTGDATAETQSGDPRSDARVPGTGTDNTSEINSTPATTASQSSVGVLTDSTWQGAVHGREIGWDPAVWFVNAENPDDLVSLPEESEDTIVLQAQTETDTAIFYISVYGDTTATPDEYLDYWMSEDFLAQPGSSGGDIAAELVNSRTRGGDTAVIITYQGSGGEYVLIRQAVALDDGTLLIVTLDAPAADAAAIYEQALNGVTIDGEPIFRVFSVSQIQRAFPD